MGSELCKFHTFVVDVGLFHGGKALFVKYKDLEKYDGEAGWFLPDDGLRDFEHPEVGAKRVLREQLGLSIASVSFGFIESFKGDNDNSHLSFHYKVDLDEQPELKPSPELVSAEWFDVSKPPDRSDVAHNGWGLSTLRELARRTPT